MIMFKQLKEAAKINKGKILTRAKIVPGPYPVIGGGLVPIGYHSDFNRPSDTVSVSNSGYSAGTVLFWSAPIFSGSDCLTLETNSCELLPRFLYLYMLEKQEALHAMARGTHVKHIDVKSLSALKVPIPSIEHQKAIIEKMGVYDHLLSKLKHQIELTGKRYRHHLDADEDTLDALSDEVDALKKELRLREKQRRQVLRDLMTFE